MIEVYNDFFSEEIQKEVLNKLIKSQWHLTGGSETNSFWHSDDLEKDEYFNTFLYKKICEKLDRNFGSIERIYANGQTAGQCGTPHKDDGDMTFLYYPSLQWNIDMQGHLIFLNESGDEGHAIVIHKPNRAVLFSGNIWHYAYAPSRFFNGLRISLAYKLWEQR